MSYMKVICAALLLIAWAVLSPQIVLAQRIDPKTYIPKETEILKHKKPYDDPRPVLKTFGPKQLLPKALYEKISYDPKVMKKAWSDVVGFKAPDVVGKIAPDIKPGKYTYKDVQQNPGFKQLMWPDMYNRIKPGGSPHVGNIPEFEIIPTQQYYWALPIAEATKKNLGKTKLTDKGYIIDSTYEAGYPFPKPEGPHKAWQIMYNFEKRYIDFGNDFYQWSISGGFTKNLVLDTEQTADLTSARMGSRVVEPIRWFDKRAELQREHRAFAVHYITPRDVSGTIWTGVYYGVPEKPDLLMIYIAALRRARKLSSSDTQDAMNGSDATYDDVDMFLQKLSPTVFPYKIEVIDEREFLVPATTEDGSLYMTRKTGELRNVRMERRPVYVLKLTQLDKTYIYSYRVFYVDKETFNMLHTENYDQRGRLYRTWDVTWGWFPEMGAFAWSGGINLLRDHVDLHSTAIMAFELPAFYTRKDVSMEGKVGAK